MAKKQITGRSAQFWLEHVKKWQQSGMSQAEYCRQTGISSKSFGHWKRHVDLGTHALTENAPDTTQTETPLIVPVSLSQPVSTQCSEPLRLHVGDKYSLDIQGDFCPATLQKLLRTLDRVS